MAFSRAAALQLSPFSEYLEAELRSRFELVRWFELDERRRASWLAEHAALARAVVTDGQIGCAAELIEALPALGIVAINGVGFDKVDLEVARHRGVRVTTTPDVLTDDVADLAVGHVIALLRGLPAADAFVRAGAWATRGDLPLARKVTGRRFGIFGLGRIGAAIAARLAAFGPVSYASRTPKDVPYTHHPDALSLARASDVLVLASASNPSTRHVVGPEVLDALGPSGYLVNIARGALVDEPALIAALSQGALAGAALDVFEDEPNVPEALRKLPNVVLSPHMASATIETRRRMSDLVLANLDAFMRGAPSPTALTL